MTQRIEPGSLVLTPQDARMLYQAARLGELRTRNRVGNTALYALLTELTICAFTAEPGIEPRHHAESEEREWWSVKQLARATGQSERTIRLHIEKGDLPATKTGSTWAVTSSTARTYIQGKRKT